LCADALPAALLGGLLETIGWQPLFAAPDEPPRDALRRLRPRLVLADPGYDAAWTAAFLGPARMLSIPVMVLGAAKSPEAAWQLAREYHLPSLLLPTDPASLARCLDEALAAR
jgi:hypothetical protein